MSDIVPRKGTCIFKVPDVFVKDNASVVTRKEIIENIVKKMDWKSLVCVQLMPNYFVRVSFKSEEAKDIFIQRGFSLRGIAITVQDADPRVNFVYVHHLPTEVADQSLIDHLRSFGKVASCQRQRDRDFPTVETGTRIVRMVVEHTIPPRSRVLRYPCRLWYKEQPKSCRVCLKEGHLASQCPLKGKCLRCGSPEHMARECTRAWSKLSVQASTSKVQSVSSAESSEVQASSIVMPAAVEPAVVEPVDVEPAIVEPVVAQPAVIEPVVAQPAVIEPMVAQPAIVKPAVAQPVIVQPSTPKSDDSSLFVPPTNPAPVGQDWQIASSRRSRKSPSSSKLPSQQRSRSRTPMRDDSRSPSASPVRSSSQPARP